VFTYFKYLKYIIILHFAISTKQISVLALKIVKMTEQIFEPEKAMTEKAMADSLETGKDDELFRRTLQLSLLQQMMNEWKKHYTQCIPDHEENLPYLRSLILSAEEKISKLQSEIDALPFEESLQCLSIYQQRSFASLAGGATSSHALPPSVYEDDAAIAQALSDCLNNDSRKDAGSPLPPPPHSSSLAGGDSARTKLYDV